MIYTVIGVYDNDGEVFADQVEASGPHEAMQISAHSCRFQEGMPTLDDIQILGAVEGAVMLVPPCEDSGKAAYASDLAMEPVRPADCQGHEAWGDQGLMVDAKALAEQGPIVASIEAAEKEKQ